MERPYSQAVRAAIAAQKAMAGSFEEAGFPEAPRLLGGADIAFAKAPDGTRTGSVGAPAIGIAIVWDLRERRLVDAAYVRTTVQFPYVPGLLSFREAPILEAAIGALRMPLEKIDAWMFDGQGRAHPRGVGLATHMGILLNRPSIGAAKSVLVGRYEVPAVLTRLLGARKAAPPRRTLATAKAPPEFPITTPVVHKDQEIARAVWTTLRTEPMIISPGHRCTLEEAVATTIAATLPGRWMPEPTRLADELTKRTRDLSETDGRALVLAQVAV
jgi:deoxyribonuclease V